MWKIVRGVIGIISPPCGDAHYLASARQRPGAHRTGRCHSPQPARARHLSRRTRTPKCH